MHFVGERRSRVPRRRLIRRVSRECAPRCKCLAKYETRVIWFNISKVAQLASLWRTYIGARHDVFVVTLQFLSLSTHQRFQRRLCSSVTAATLWKMMLTSAENSTIFYTINTLKISFWTHFRLNKKSLSIFLFPFLCRVCPSNAVLSTPHWPRHWRHRLRNFERHLWTGYWLVS